MFGGKIRLDHLQPPGKFSVPVPVEVYANGKKPVNEPFVCRTMVNLPDDFNPGVLEEIVSFAAVSHQLTAKGVKRFVITLYKNIAQLKLSCLAARNDVTIIQHFNYLY
jgi:hypothetical protein